MLKFAWIQYYSFLVIVYVLIYALFYSYVIKNKVFDSVEITSINLKAVTNANWLSDILNFNIKNKINLLVGSCKQLQLLILQLSFKPSMPHCNEEHRMKHRPWKAKIWTCLLIIREKPFKRLKAIRVCNRHSRDAFDNPGIRKKSFTTKDQWMYYQLQV